MIMEFINRIFYRDKTINDLKYKLDRAQLRISYYENKDQKREDRVRRAELKIHEIHLYFDLIPKKVGE